MIWSNTVKISDITFPNVVRRRLKRILLVSHKILDSGHEHPGNGQDNDEQYEAGKWRSLVWCTGHGYYLNTICLGLRVYNRTGIGIYRREIFHMGLNPPGPEQKYLAGRKGFCIRVFGEVEETPRPGSLPEKSAGKKGSRGTTALDAVVTVFAYRFSR
jgi:hypothetical protein